MTIDARINLGVIPVKSELERQGQLSQLYAQRQQMDLQREQADAERQQQAQAAQREQAGMIAKLTRGVRDEGSYQQARRAAEAYGIDIAGAPANYDPDWVQTQHIIADTFYRQGPEKLTNTAQELMEAGFEPGTLEFQRRMAQRISMQDSKVITTSDGGMASLLTPEGVQPVILPNPGDRQAGSPSSGYAGGPRQISSDADYEALPPGAAYTAPDGSIRRKGGQPAQGRGPFGP